MPMEKHAVRQAFLETSAGQIHYWTAGAGAPLLMIHQSGNSSEEYAGLVPYLADRYRLIALDLPGHGRSADPDEEPGVDDYAAAARAVLDALEVKKTHILGHHGGCLTAMSLLAHEPDRFDKAIFSGIGGMRTEKENHAFREKVMATDTNVSAESAFMGDAWMRYIAMASDGAAVSDTLKPFIAFLQARLRPYRGVLINLNWDRRPAMAKLRGPILLVQGDKDGFVHDQESLLSALPNSERLVLEGCGAFMFYDRPKTCADMVAAYLQ